MSISSMYSSSADPTEPVERLWKTVKPVCFPAEPILESDELEYFEGVLTAGGDDVSGLLGSMNRKADADVLDNVPSLVLLVSVWSPL